jgi:hypothetical protein
VRYSSKPGCIEGPDMSLNTSIAREASALSDSELLSSLCPSRYPWTAWCMLVGAMSYLAPKSQAIGFVMSPLTSPL